MIDVLKYRTITALISFALLAGTIGTYIYRERTRGSGFSYSVDFSGGTQVLVRLEKPVGSEGVKKLVEGGGWNNPTVREFQGGTEVLIRVAEFTHDAKGVADKILQTLVTALPDNQVTLLETEAVGPSVGAELRWNAVKAVLIALLILLLYIAIVFWSAAFAVGAVAALAHDALIILGFFLIFDHEISINVIGAVLAVLGYSINDTIVIFSAIRSNLKKMKGVPLYDVVNISINQTLKRTLLTSFSTALTVGSMLLLGGQALHDFALTLMLGIIFGTYSSIYIASPVMMLLYNRKKDVVA